MVGTTDESFPTMQARKQKTAKHTFFLDTGHLSSPGDDMRLLRVSVWMVISVRFQWDSAVIREERRLAKPWHCEQGGGGESIRLPSLAILHKGSVPT